MGTWFIPGPLYLCGEKILYYIHRTFKRRTEMRKMRLDRKSKAKVMAQLKELTLKMKKEN